MPKRSKSEKTVGGPFLAAAVFCEKVIEDSNGFLSALRIIDGCSVSITPGAPPDFPSISNPIRQLQNALLIFKTGDSPGKHMLSFIVQDPDGKRSTEKKQEINLGQEPQGGMNVKTVAELPVHVSGVYWLDIYLDGKRITRMPFSVTLQRAGPSASAPNKS